MKKVYCLNGPNLNRLGKREPHIYGIETLQDVQKKLQLLCETHRVELIFLQSNHEGELIDSLHEADDESAIGVIFNPAAYTHTSIALRDAVAAIKVPVIEVHISNVHRREAFRHQSMLASECIGQIVGLGTYGYELAFQAFINLSKGE